MLGQSPWEAAGTEITGKSPSSSGAGLCWALLARLGQCWRWGVAARQHPQRSARPRAASSISALKGARYSSASLLAYSSSCPGTSLPAELCVAALEARGPFLRRGLTSSLLPRAPAGDVSPQQEGTPPECPQHGLGMSSLARLGHIPSVPSQSLSHTALGALALLLACSQAVLRCRR